ncbi:MAG: hypothetical protein ACRD8U_12390 [Pyrinomonadaceae bacterium]
MRSSMMKAAGNSVRLLLLVVIMCALVGASTISAPATSGLPAMAILVTNNSGRDIHHLYLSPADREAWGPDLLNETVLRTGQSFTISDVSCAGYEIKVIAEDREGCFAYAVVSCAQASTGWTITSETPRDCGN